MNLNLQIERIVLDGFELNFGQRRQLQDAFEAELTRLLSGSPIFSVSVLVSGGAVGRLKANNLTLDAETDPARLGQRLARTIYQSLEQM